MPMEQSVGTSPIRCAVSEVHGVEQPIELSPVVVTCPRTLVDKKPSINRIKTLLFITNNLIPKHDRAVSE